MFSWEPPKKSPAAHFSDAETLFKHTQRWLFVYGSCEPTVLIKKFVFEYQGLYNDDINWKNIVTLQTKMFTIVLVITKSLGEPHGRIQKIV